MKIQIDYKSVCLEALQAARDAGNFIFERINSISRKSIESKGRQNFVTEMDKAAEVMIIERLQSVVSGAGFIAEEGTSSEKGDYYNWIIDPLDGTTNFIHGAPPVAVSIALAEDGVPVVGVVYEIFLKEAFYAWKGSAAYLNGKEIHVSEAVQVKDMLIATGFPYHNFDRIDGFMGTINHFFCNSHGVRRMGSAATDLAYVACGRYDGFYEYNLNPWDVAAGALIILQAGGLVSDFRGSKDYIFGREIVASNKLAHTEFLRDVGQFMNQ
jgi:myo-inositol-1(or 4)-monophosphatase